jgi:hypothetical protein
VDASGRLPRLRVDAFSPCLQNRFDGYRRTLQRLPPNAPEVVSRNRLTLGGLLDNLNNNERSSHHYRTAVGVIPEGRTMRANLGLRGILSLLILTTNVVAPFSTSSLVRVFLGSVLPNVASSPIVRVRAVSHGGVTQGFRAVVGLANGGQDGSAPQPKSRTTSTFSLPERPHRLHSLGFGLTRPTPPLRC